MSYVYNLYLRWLVLSSRLGESAKVRHFMKQRVTCDLEPPYAIASLTPGVLAALGILNKRLGIYVIDCLLGVLVEEDWADDHFTKLAVLFCL